MCDFATNWATEFEVDGEQLRLHSTRIVYHDWIELNFRTKAISVPLFWYRYGEGYLKTSGITIRKLNPQKQAIK